MVWLVDLQTKPDSIVSCSVPFDRKCRQNVEVIFALRILTRLIAHNYTTSCLVSHRAFEILRFEGTALDVDEFLLKLRHFKDVVDLNGGFRLAENYDFSLVFAMICMETLIHECRYSICL